MHLEILRFDNQIFRLVKILLGLCLLTPLLAFDSFLFPFVSSKSFIFRILVEIAAVLYFYLALKYPAIFLPSFKKGGFLGLSVLFFLAINFLSAIFGVDFNLSFWGNLERGGGVWGLFHFILFFGMLSMIFQKKEERIFFLKLSLGASFFVSLLAISQKFFSLGDLMPQTDRVFGSLGNPAFLATFLIFNIFFAGYLIFLSRSRSFIIYCFLLAVDCFALFLTGTRGAFLGFLAGAIVFLILIIFIPSSDVIPAKAGIQTFGSRVKPGMTKKKKQIVSSLLVLIFIIIGSLFLFRNFSFIKNSPTFSRLTSISLEDTTAQNRLILWQKAWLAWQERPILGFGTENYEVAANKYFDPRLNPYEAWYDKAHNFIFDYGVSLGWLGFFSYLFLIFTSLFCLWKIRFRDLFFSMVFGSLLMAYLVQNFFVFDTFAAYLMLFFVLALIFGASEKEDSFERKDSREPRPLAGKISFFSFKKSLLAVLAVAVIFSIYSFNLKPLLAAYRANEILSLSISEAPQTAPMLKEALDLGTFASPEILYQTTMDYLSRIEDDPQLAANREFYELASAELLKTVQNSPQQARYYVALAWLNLYFYDQQDKGKLDFVEDLGQKIKILAPAKKEAYLILSATYFLTGQKDRAEQAIVEAYNIDKSLGDRVKVYWESLNR